jgi:hypothetical protein
MSFLDTNIIITNTLFAENAEITEAIIDDIAGITIEGVNDSTGTFIKTPLLKTNTIDFSNEDLSFISFISDVSSDLSAGFVQFDGTELSAVILEVNDLSVNFIGSNGNDYVNFMRDVSITNTIKVDDFKTKFLSATDPSMVMYSDVSSDGKFNIETLTSNNFNKKSTHTQFIEITQDVSTNKRIEALDVSVSNSVKVANDLSLSKIGAYDDIVTFVNDLSINGNTDISSLLVNNIHALSENQITVEGDLSINNNLFVKDLSFNGNIFPIDGCLNVTGQVSFSKTIKAKECNINTIQPFNQDNKFIFDSKVKIEGKIKATHKPKQYRAYHSTNYSDLVIELATKYGDGALGLLSEDSGKEDYLKNKIDNFDSDFSLARYDGVDNIDSSVVSVTLYVQKTPGSLKKIRTINKPITFGSIKHNKDVIYDGNDISYLHYDTADSSTIIANVTTDLSCDFSYNRYEMIGLSGGIFYPNTRKNTHYFDFSGRDPEFIDVSYIIGDYHDNSGYTVNIERYYNPNFDSSKTRLVIVTPSSKAASPDFSLNVAGHDYTNYTIRTIKLKEDQVLEKAVRPVWDAIRFKTYDVCLEGMYQDSENNTGHDIVFTDFSWNDLSLSNPISTADTRDISSAFFDISLNQYFGDNSHNLKYTIDLSGFNVNTKYDVSFNIDSAGSLKDRIELSGNIITVNTCIDNDKTLNDFSTDTTINIVLHNYYEFHLTDETKDASFDFVAAGIGDTDISYSERDLYKIVDTVSYTKDVSRNIILRAKDIIRNTPPVFTDLSFYGISYEGGQAGWDKQFYNDNSFDYSFGTFTDICFNKIDKTTDPSFTYYIWDTSSIRDNSALEYRLDFSAIDHEGFDISFDVSYFTDTSMTIGLYNENKEIIVRTSGNRDPTEIDTSFSIYADDNGDFNGDRDCCYNRIELRFHPFLYKFKEFTFTNCDTSGRLGPSLADCSKFYTDRYDNGAESYSLDNWWTDISYLDQSSDNGIQIWTVPATGQYDITIAGAGGGRSYTYNKKYENLEGYGARFDTSAILTRGDKYRILIGQKGYLGNKTTIDTELATGHSNYLPYSSSGGGATFFVKDDPLIDGDIDELIDIKDLVIAVAGGGSGGRTWTREDGWEARRDVTDASIDTSTEKFLGIAGLYNESENIRTNIKPEQRAPGRGGGSNETNDIGDIVFGGGGGGGGIIRPGGLAGHDGDNTAFLLDSADPYKVMMKTANSFLDGGTGGYNVFSPIYGANADAIGDAKEGGFGGGAAGGEGGSGGGGGYAGGGSDAHDVTTGENINPKNPSFAGGGSSYYKDHISDPSHNIPDSPGSDQVDGYLHIRFNPYNN